MPGSLLGLFSYKITSIVALLAHSKRARFHISYLLDEFALARPWTTTAGASVQNNSLLRTEK
jgi:hypothetical protein